MSSPPLLKDPCGYLRRCGNLMWYVQCCAPAVAVFRNGRGELVNVCGAHLAAADATGLGFVERVEPNPGDQPR